VEINGTGTLRRSSGADSAELVKQPHGGALRRGGGAPARSADQVAAARAIREGSLAAATTLVKAAADGNLKAAELVLAYAIGRPRQRVEISDEAAPWDRAFVDDLNDQEKRALRDAIRAEIGSKDATGA